MSSRQTSLPPRVVLVAVGHNEAEHLEATIQGLLEASRPEDQVWYADSASTDMSLEIADELGVESLNGPLGKGAVMEAARQEIPFSEWMCFLDGDLGRQSARVAAGLRSALDGAEAGMLVGQFWAVGPSLLPSTQGVYAPLVDALFPEVNDRFGTRPLSGFRALSREVELELPEGFGVEAFLNISVVLMGLSTKTVDLGCIQNPFRFKPQMPSEIATAILDLAQREERISESGRTAWEEWVQGLIEPFNDYRGEADRCPEMVAHLRRWLAGDRPGRD